MQRKTLIIVLILFICSFSACGKAPVTNSSTLVNNYTLTIDSLKQEYRLVYVSDLHIINDETQVDQEHLTTVFNRKTSMTTSDGKTAVEYWPEMIECINELHPDLVLLGGDMLDYMSVSNADYLKESLKSIQAPVMYVRADHDYANWYNTALPHQDITKLGDNIHHNAAFMTHDLEEFTVIGINNSTEQFSVEALHSLENFFHTQTKPVLILTHVPFQSAMDHDLDTLSKDVWQNRALIWGKDCYYTPDVNTKRAMELIYHPDNQVKAVFSGHLHFSHIGNLTDNIKQFVFAPAYLGNLAVITIKGSE